MERNLWTFVPTSHLKTTTSAASPCVRDMPVSTLDCTSPNPDTGLWLSSNGKPMQRPLSWRGWQTRPWVRHLSGTTCEPSTADRGVAAFISSLPVIHASPSASQANAPVRTTRVTFGPRLPESSTKSNPNGSSAKTSRDTCRWDTPTSPPAFAAWATRQRRESLQREKQAQATGVAACSSWPTPTASDGGYVPDLILDRGTFRVTSPLDISEGSGGQYPLSETARAWTSLWLTLQAVGWTSKMASSPSSHQVRVSFKNGKGSCIASLKPNPQFYEMIMGWPIGWTAPGAQVTGYAAWLRRSRGQFSRLLTTWTADT